MKTTPGNWLIEPGNRVCIESHAIKGHKQKGVVLFFALIALVVMSLAAVALIRTVDTNSMIAGNLSFKQTSMLTADNGVETAMTWILGNSALLTADSLVDGYYATSDVAPHPNARTLVDASGVVATANDGQGNSISYVVQRMCRNAGAPDLTHCLFGPLTEPPKDNSGGTNIPLPLRESQNLMYRVTAKVVGPKNTVSYIQTFVY